MFTTLPSVMITVDPFTCTHLVSSAASAGKTNSESTRFETGRGRIFEKFFRIHLRDGAKLKLNY